MFRTRTVFELGAFAILAVGMSDGIALAQASALPVNGLCGSASHQPTYSAPDGNLCSQGQSTAVDGQGPWSWSCLGLQGGLPVQCSAGDVGEAPSSIGLPTSSAMGLSIREPSPNATIYAGQNTTQTVSRFYASPEAGLTETKVSSPERQGSFEAQPYRPQSSGGCEGDLACTAQFPLKPPLRGLISMGQTGPGADNTNAQYYYVSGNSLDDLVIKRNAFDGVVINVPWVALQPLSADNFDFGAIDNELDAIRAYNSDPQTTLPLRAILRLWPGPNAPDWAKNLDGPPVTAYFNYSPHSAYTVGRFWMSGYRAAWRNLLNTLAEKYDTEPLISQVFNSSCSSHDDEPPSLARYYDQSLNESSIQDLHDAGFTDAAYQFCLADSMNDYAAWKRTPVNNDFGFIFLTDGVGPYQNPPHDSSFTTNLMASWRQEYGDRVVLSNHNLNVPLDNNQIPIYDEIQKLGPQTEFQTHAPGTLNWAATVTECVALGGHSLELWNHTGAGGDGVTTFDGYLDVPIQNLFQWSAQLKAP